MVAVFLLRLLLSLADPDLVHPVDPAELSHLDVWPMLADGRLAWLLGADANVHHGGFFWLGLPVGIVRAVSGSDLWAVRGVAAACAALSWGAWTALAHRIGGRWAAVGLGLCLAVPSPWMAQWTATLWGSHAEAGIWTGLWGLALASGWRARTVGVLLGIGVGWDPLLWPAALVTWGFTSERRSAVLPLLLAWMAARLPVLLADPLGLVMTSLSENPRQTVLGLLAGMASPGDFAASLRNHTAWPWVSTAAVGDAVMPLNGGLTLLWAIGACVSTVLHGPRRTLGRWLVLSVMVHFCVLVLLSPTRPELTERYLVAWWPAVLLLPWMLPGRLRGLAVGPVLASLCALPLLVASWGDVSLSRLQHYPAKAFQHLGLDRVPAHRAAPVEAFLNQRSGSATEGFAAAFSPRLGYPVWGEPFPDQVRAAGLPARLKAARLTGDPVRVDRDFGYGLVVVCAAEPSCVANALDGLALAGLDAQRVREGVAEADGMPAAGREALP